LLNLTPNIKISVIRKEEEIHLIQIEQEYKNEIKQAQLMDQIKTLQNGMEEMKNLVINNNENHSPKRKRSNSFDDILPKKHLLNKIKKEMAKEGQGERIIMMIGKQY
jgi:hypothetical protein